MRRFLDLAANHVQFSVSRVFSLLQLYCRLLVLQLLYFCPQGLGPQDGIAAVVDKRGNLLEFLVEFAEGEDAILLCGHIAEVRLSRKDRQFMDERYLLAGSANNPRDFFGDLDEVFHFAFEHLQLALFLGRFAELASPLPPPHQSAVDRLRDVKHRMRDVLQSVEGSAVLAKLALAVGEVELLVEEEMPQLRTPPHLPVRQQFLQIPLQLTSPDIGELLRLHVQSGQEVFLRQPRQDTSPVASEQLVLQELEVVEAATDLGGRARALLLLAANAIELVTGQQSLLDEFWSQHLHRSPLEEGLVLFFLLAAQSLLLWEHGHLHPLDLSARPQLRL